MRSRLAFLEVAMTEPSARPSASRTRAFFTAAYGQIKAWLICKQPETQGAARSPASPRLTLPPHPKEELAWYHRAHMGANSTPHSPGFSMGTTSKPHGSTRPRFLPTGVSGLRRD